MGKVVAGLVFVRAVVFPSVVYTLVVTAFWILERVLLSGDAV